MPKHHIFGRFLFCFSLLLQVSCGVKKAYNTLPNISKYDTQIPATEKINDSTFIAGSNFLTKNKQGLWEMYLEGNPYQRGELIGSLAGPLMEKQEKVFMDKIEELVPSEGRQKFLRKFLAWYNRKIFDNISEEYKAEIFGVSKYMSEDYNSFAPSYLRALYLHSAHDIGHALQDLAMVGCTSFAVWDYKSEDGELLIGRNFDFYAGDDFAEEKVVYFVNPDQGHKYMSISWAGFIGVVSGMNDQGLTVTINAAKSKIPLVAKTPISIVTREILQYASNIEEAIAIAKKRQVFVSESIMIGSAKDKKAILIEVSPNNFGVYDVENSDQLICSNHFQSDAFKNDNRNEKAIAESHSEYRYERMQELLRAEQKVNVKEAVEILRNKEGLKDKTIGYGNEKAINQMLAHHGIVFKPEKLKVWVSSNPYQMGEFVAYDLNEVFRNREIPSEISISSSKNNIEADAFIYTPEFKDYQEFRELSSKVEKSILAENLVAAEELSRLENLNPEYWKAYFLVGKYFYEHKNYQEALKAFNLAKTKEITTLVDEKELSKMIKKSKRKLK
ncbi:Acyl-coenzyme A:6-aminopenicillanic acid acyl-transferase [Flavobacteriaceae bacterium MAR_2010_188]|nr:Acyl-coenzyme A:6-aminopenicillanic acid acyl-transferase [Flavobacteriaceae bacterium MAR_2010_188]